MLTYKRAQTSDKDQTPAKPAGNDNQVASADKDTDKGIAIPGVPEGAIPLILDLLIGFGAGAAITHFLTPSPRRSVKRLLTGGAAGAAAAYLLNDILQSAGQDPHIAMSTAIGAVIGAATAPVVFPVEDRDELLARLIGAVAGGYGGKIVGGTFISGKKEESPRGTQSDQSATAEQQSKDLPERLVPEKVLPQFVIKGPPEYGYGTIRLERPSIIGITEGGTELTATGIVAGGLTGFGVGHIAGKPRIRYTVGGAAIGTALAYALRDILAPKQVIFRPIPEDSK